MKMMASMTMVSQKSLQQPLRLPMLLQATQTASFSANQAKKEGKRSKPEYVYGANPVYAALRAQRRDFQKLYLNIAEKDGEQRMSNTRIAKISALAKQAGIQTKYMHRAKLSKFCGGRQHQNVVLKCGKLAYTDIRSMKDVVDIGTSQAADGQEQDRAAPPEGKFFLFLD